MYQNDFWYDLGTLGGGASYAFDLNDSGIVVGSSGTWSNRFARNVEHAIVSQNGQMRDIDDFQSSRSEALGINDNGDVIGYYLDDSGYYHAFLWTSSSGMQDLGVPDSGYPNSFAYDINNNGEIVGTSGTTDNAVRYKNGQWQYLNNLIPADSGWNLQRAEAINDEGQIVSWGTINGQTCGFLLTPGSSTPSDTTEPTLDLPADITEEAAGTNGAQVAYNATATDDVEGNVPVDCSPASGSTFPTGTTAVNCSATDAAGNEAAGGFNVTVRDTTAPSISGVPADIIKTTTSASGTQVSYDYPTANDVVEGSVSVNCQPPSGSTFATGETAVSCSATDRRTNTATKTFKVTVVYDFGNGSGGGFSEPVTDSALNQVKAGAGVPVKFGLGGDLGLSIFASGYPISRKISCDTQATIDPIEQTVAISTSGLKYDATTGQYVYNWKTEKAWSNTCRQLVVKLKDGTEHPVSFKFK